MNKEKVAEGFIKLLEIVEKLRGPDGCSWDRAQTHESLLPYFLKQKKSKIILAGSLYGSISPNPNLYLDKTGEPFFQKPIDFLIWKFHDF